MEMSTSDNLGARFVYHRRYSQCTWRAAKLQREDLADQHRRYSQCTWYAEKLQREDLLTSTEGALNVHGVQRSCSLRNC